MYFGFDDDIIYADGHVRRLRAALIRYGGHAIVGVHGVRFRSPNAPYTKDRRVRLFTDGLRFDEVVDEIGCGTCGFVSSELPVDPPSWPHGDMDDLMIAIEAERRGLPRIAVRRPWRSIFAAFADEDESLWRQTVADHSRQTEQLKTLLRLMKRRH